VRTDVTSTLPDVTARSTGRRLRRAASLGLAVLTAAGLAACSSTNTSTSPSVAGKLKPDAPFKLGVSLTLNNTDFWTSYISYEKKFADQYKATLIGPVVANGDAGKQLTDIRTLIAQGAQALIVNPVDSDAIQPALDFAASKGVPVISVDVAPTKGKVFTIVRANNELYGQEACKYIGTHVKSGAVAQLQGDLASLNGRDRSTAFSECMKSSYPGLKVVNYPTKWNSATATNAASTALSSVANLKAIYAQWSGPVSGVLQAEKSTGHYGPVGDPKHVVLVSNDGVPFELQDIRNGAMDATISQPADQYAQYSVLYARQALEGKTYKAGDSTGHDSGNFVTVFGNLEDPIKAPLVTKDNAADPALWGNHGGK
jgi:simple sugar transport system substrate-binding protein/ribose transport system substrate-binding protein